MATFDLEMLELDWESLLVAITITYVCFVSSGRSQIKRNLAVSI